MSDEQQTSTEKPEAPPETTTEPAPPVEEKPAETTEEKPAEVELVTTADFELADPAYAEDPHFKQFIDVMNDKDLSPKARAQALFKLQSDVVKGISEKGATDFIKMNEDWQAQTRADPMFAGDKLNSALSSVAKIIDRFGSPELREAMDLTGAGNHPATVKFLYNIGQVLNEPGGDNVPAKPGTTPRSAADILYPNQGKS